MDSFFDARRRQFFTTLALGSAASLARTASAQGPATLAPMDQRMERAQAVRSRLADYYRNLPPVEHPVNGDEDLYPNKINSFSKTLLHRPNGEVDPTAYRSLRRAVESGRNEDFELIVRGGNVRLKNPTGAYNFQLAGADPSQYTMPAAPKFDSAQQAGEMVELYWQALARDIPFSEYESNTLIASACQDLSRMRDFRGPKENGRVTPKTVFRGPTPGDLAGPYVSQFLVKPFLMGGVAVEQKIPAFAPQLDFMLTFTDWFGIQIGEGKGPGNRRQDVFRYMRNGRDLATFVHDDWSFSPYYHALWILLNLGADAFSADNPYLYSKGQEPYINFGPPDGFEYVSRSAKPAFNAAWFQKWFVHHRARPEAFAARVFQTATRNEAYPIHSDVLESQGLENVFRKWGTYLLPQAYSEGCPAHSAYPSGHATVAGACVTMLKAFFREDFVLPDPVTPSADGLRLEKYTGAPLTVGGELNKMAFNIAMGRNFAGIHWRTDAVEGLKLGEQVAINVLRDLRATYLDDFGGLSFTRFNGEKIVITSPIA